ncbi:MAG: hypothetical protein ACTS43_00600 [Candidatus Hodgkinia cicadicola]
MLRFRNLSEPKVFSSRNIFERKNGREAANIKMLSARKWTDNFPSNVCVKFKIFRTHVRRSHGGKMINSESCAKGTNLN